MKTTRPLSRFLGAVLFATVIMASPAFAAGENVQTKAVHVNGAGIVSVQPDTAILNLGIETKGASARIAQQKNTSEIKKLMDALVASGIAKDDIQTEWYNIYPEYDYSKEGNSNKITGYRANHQLRVKVRDLSKVSATIEIATATGVNQINNVSYTVEKKDEAIDKARKLAAEDAQKKAKKLSEIFGFQMGKIISVSEYSDSGSVPMYMGGAVMESAANTKNNVINPGKIEVRLDLNISYEIL